MKTDYKMVTGETTEEFMQRVRMSREQQPGETEQEWLERLSGDFAGGSGEDDNLTGGNGL